MKKTIIQEHQSADVAQLMSSKSDTKMEDAKISSEEYSSREMLKLSELFWLVREQKNDDWLIAIGNQIVYNTKTKNKLKARMIAKSKPMEMIINTILTVIKFKNNVNN